MDGLLQSTHAATSLLALANTPNRNLTYASPPVSRRNSKEAPDTPDEKKTEFVMTGVKRTLDPNMLSVIYSNGKRTMAVPLFKDDSDDIFHARRRIAADMLFDKTRADVFCSWRKTLINMRTVDDRWVKFRDTFREQRFMYKNLQLVVLRFTCSKGHQTACSNCATPSRRLSCLTPSVYSFLLPLPGSDGFTHKTADTVVDDFDPISVKQPTDEWEMHIPALHVRSP
tara:strand:+ start:707 stop:1387 length:681 start_codon:yes stop_codon:yes gene_type:complete